MINPIALVRKDVEKQQLSRGDRVRSGKYNPSLLGRCFRLQHYNRKNTPESNPPDTDTLMLFRMGNIVEADLASFLPKKSCQVEVDWEDVHGFADFVDEDEVVDFKTAGNWQFKKVSKAGYRLEDDNMTYLLQVMIYAMILGKRKGRIIFIQKDTYLTKEFVFKLEDWESAVHEELDILRGFWNQDRLPPPSPRAFNGRECNYCSYKDTCIEETGDNHPALKKGK